MTETKNEVRSIHWAVKLLLTVLVGGLLAVGAFFLPIDLVATVMPRAIFGPLYLVCLTTIFATFLYLRERNGWRRSLLMGVVVGLVGSAITMILAFMFVILLLSNVHFV